MRGGDLQGARRAAARVLPPPPRPGPSDGHSPSGARRGGTAEEGACPAPGLPAAVAVASLRTPFPCLCSCLSPSAPADSGLVIFCTGLRVTSVAARRPRNVAAKSPREPERTAACRSQGGRAARGRASLEGGGTPGSPPAPSFLPAPRSSGLQHPRVLTVSWERAGCPGSASRLGIRS